MNTAVNFQTAKLLKERGYGNTSPYKLGRGYYNHMGELNGDVTDYVKAFINKKKLTHLETIDAPTISDYGVLKPFHSEENGYLIHCPDNELLEEPKSGLIL